MSASESPGEDAHEVAIARARSYWEGLQYDDVRVARARPGTREFYAELAGIRATRLDYLFRLADFAGYRGKSVLEVGCRIGLDLARFAESGASVTGIEISRPALQSARRHFESRGLDGTFLEMDGERLRFEDNSFDLVYAHGVLQYTPGPRRMAAEMHRVLKPGGRGFFMAYSARSWMALLSKYSRRNLMHEDAPFFEAYTVARFRKLLGMFPEVTIVPERFPVRTGLHLDAPSALFYRGAVALFRVLPRAVALPLGAHLVALTRK